jgi:O-antigen ligase
MNREKVLKGMDHFTLFCFCVLVIFLPIRETESIRSFSFGIPLGLWIIKMLITREWSFVRTPADIPILLFTIVAGLSLITAVDFHYSLEEYTGEWLTGVVLFYLVVNNFRENQLKYLFGALLLGNLLMVGYGVYDFFHRGGVLFDYQVRAGSLHSGFGTFSTYLVTVLPYLLIAVFQVRKISTRLLIMVLILGNFFALYLTQARGAWIAAAVLLFLVGWRFLPKAVFLVSIALAVVFVFLFAPPKIIRHQAPITAPGSPLASIETVQARWELTKFCLEKIKENPFQMLGFGRRSFVKKYKEFYLQYKGALLWHAHNTFLDIALQTGIQGLAFFCFLLCKLLKYTYEGRALENFSWRRVYLVGTFMMIITFFIRNLSDDFFVDDSALLFWFLSGAAVAVKKG